MCCSALVGWHIVLLYEQVSLELRSPHLVPTQNYQHVFKQQFIDLLNNKIDFNAKFLKITACPWICKLKAIAFNLAIIVSTIPGLLISKNKEMSCFSQAKAKSSMQLGQFIRCPDSINQPSIFAFINTAITEY